VTKRLAPSAALETAIEELLSQGLGDAEQLAEVGRLGARLVLQRALEDEVAGVLGACPLRALSPGSGVSQRGPAAAGADG